MNMKKRTSEKGFTLVELAIVLVIIGLIVGGVLAGQDLIKAATIRAQSTQLSQYDTGALTFQNKYNGLPGDLVNATANTNFGVKTLATANGGSGAGTNGTGDNDGNVSGISAAGAAGSASNTACTASLCLAGETGVFWFELLKAQLITDGNVTNDDPAKFSIAANTIVPNAKLGGGTQVAVAGISNLNYFVLANLGGPSNISAAGAPTSKGSLSPLTAQQLDSKLDDGVPNAGKVVSVVPATIVPGVADATVGAGKCMLTATTYSTGTADGNTATLCALSIRASF